LIGRPQGRSRFFDPTPAEDDDDDQPRSPLAPAHPRPALLANALRKRYLTSPAQLEGADDATAEVAAPQEATRSPGAAAGTPENFTQE